MKLEKPVSVTAGSPNKPSTIIIPHAVTLLTPKRIASMSEAEVQEVLPQLVGILQQGLMSRRPDWWPHSTIPWTQANLSKVVKGVSCAKLRSLVSKCYNYLTQHSLEAPQQQAPSTQPRVLDWLNSNPPSRSCSQSAKTNGMSNGNQKGALPFLEIYVCIQCRQDFSTKDTLQKHQLQCNGGPLSLATPSTPPASDTPSPAPPTVASDDSSSVGAGPAPVTVVPGVPFREFVNAIDLVPVQRARRMRQARRRNTECETIDLEEPETPKPPPTPRTPKLLISQLSRDASNVSTSGGAGGQLGCRRRLSYLLQSGEKKPERPSEEEPEADGESDGESEESSTEDSDEPKLHKKSLFNIDVSSALGQRVLRHMTAEVHVPVISDAEQFCRTPIKDKYHDRLRIRHMNYPITWKLTHKRLRQQNHSHVYKFTRAQTFEFMEKMRTGLNSQCRHLLGCVRKCSVLVKRLPMKTLYKWKPSLNKITVPLKQLTDQEIEFWTQPKPPVHPSVFPDGPTFLLTDVDRVLGLKRKDGRPQGSGKLQASHCVSETANAELQQQKLTIYRSLLTDLSSSVTPEGKQRFKKRKGSLEKTQSYPTLFSILSGPSSSFKAPYKSGKEIASISEDVKNQLKIDIPLGSPALAAEMSASSSPLDDSFSILTVSSDEDTSKGAVCCSLCSRRNVCRCSPGKGRPSAAPCSGSLLSESPLSPQLTSPTVSVGASGMSQLTISVADLSPVSQGADSSPRSPVVSPSRHSTRNVRVAPKLSSSRAQLRSSASLPMSPLAHCVSAKPPALSSGVRGPGQEGKGVLPRSSSDLLQPVHSRPSTRSGSKDSLVSESSEAGLLRPAPFTRRGRKAASVSPHSLSVAAGRRRDRGRASSNSSVQSSSRTDHKASASVQRNAGKAVGHMSRLSRLQKLKQSYKTRQGSNSSEKVRKLGMLKKFGRRESSSYSSADRSERFIKRLIKKAHGGGEESCTLRSGHALSKLKMPSPGSLTSKSSVSDDARSKTLTKTPSHSQSSSPGRRSLRGNPFAATSSGKRFEPSQPRGVKRSATETSAAGPSKVRNDGGGPAASEGAETNPFLISKAQTPLFSSSVLEQARRNWSPSSKPWLHGGHGAPKATLRSGNTFRLGAMGIGFPPNNFGSEARGQRVERLPVLGPGLGSSAQLAGRNMVGVDPLRPPASGLAPLSPSPLSPSLLSPSHLSSTPRQLPPPPPHARKRLSPMQMLSVLESAKGHSCSSKGRPAGTTAATKDSRPGRTQDLAFIKITGISPGYHTRAKEMNGAANKLHQAQ